MLHFTHRTWTNGSATIPWTAVRVLDWIGLDWRKKLLEPAGACMSINPNVSRLQSSPAAAILEWFISHGNACFAGEKQQQKRADLDSTSLLAACLYTCQAGAIRAFPSSSNISPAQSPVYHQKRLMTFFLCYHFTNPSSSPKTAGKYLYCIHYIQERIRDTGRSVKFIWGDHASQATVCYNIIQKNPFFWVLYSKARFLNKPRNKTTHQLDKQLNWTNSLTTKSPSLKANQSRNGIDPLDRSSKSGPLHNQLNLTSWHLSCTKTRTARLPASVTHIMFSNEPVCQVPWYQKDESTQLPNLYLWACPPCLHLYTPSRSGRYQRNFYFTMLPAQWKQAIVVSTA
jgi:hypothetical protein